MNNYSWLQKKLHKLALSSKFMRKATFDFECSNISCDKENKNENHVFITGLARSGTTILLNAIYKSDLFASLTYRDMPFVLAPNFWSKIVRNKSDIFLRERAHGDGIYFSIKSPEAFEEVFWNTFEGEEDIQEKFRSFIRNINFSYKKNRYLSKNNQNIKRLKLLSTTFPKSKILIPFREPIQTAYSLLNQHKRFLGYSQEDVFISQYMKWIGHKEFGANYMATINGKLTYPNDLDINHWIEHWYITYKKLFKVKEYNKNFCFICYEKLCNESDYWFKILEKLEIKKPFKFEFKESKKNIILNIDDSLLKKSLTLYEALCS